MSKENLLSIPEGVETSQEKIEVWTETISEKVLSFINSFKEKLSNIIDNFIPEEEWYHSIDQVEAKKDRFTWNISFDETPIYTI